MRLRTKILLPACSLILASTLAIYLTVLNKSAQLEHEREQSLAFSARSIQDMIDRCLFERYGDVQAFGLNTIVQRDLATLDDTSREAIINVINNYVTAYGCYPLSYITDTSGKIIAINSIDASGTSLPAASKLIGQTVSRSEWFLSISAGRFTTGKNPDGSPALSGTVVTSPTVDPNV